MSTPAEAVAPLERRTSERLSYIPLALFCLAHFWIDLYSIALSAFQPLLIDKFGISLTQAGFLGGMLVFSSSVMQPVYGYLADRFHTRMFTVLAPAVAAVFICSLGFAANYPSLLAMVFLTGVGVAMFHPQATANATLGITENRGRAMATFISAGTLGMAIGPAYFTWLTRTTGLNGALWAALPGLAVTALLFPTLRFAPRERARQAFDWLALKAESRELTLLFLLVFIRSIVQVSFAQLLPLYLTRQRGYSLTAAAAIAGTYLAAGAIGGFAGGNLADRFGGRRVIIASMIGSVPLLLGFVWTTGWISIACLALGGLALLFTIPINVMMGQELVPSQAGVISALMMGFAWGTAGLIFIPLAGWVSDRYSMQAAFQLLVLFPLAGFFLALKLRRTAA